MRLPPFTVPVQLVQERIRSYERPLGTRHPPNFLNLGKGNVLQLTALLLEQRSKVDVSMLRARVANVMMLMMMVTMRDGDCDYDDDDDDTDEDGDRYHTMLIICTSVLVAFPESRSASRAKVCLRLLSLICRPYTVHSAPFQVAPGRNDGPRCDWSRVKFSVLSIGRV